MDFWSWVQQKIWTGRVVKDYGTIGDRSVRHAHRSLSVVFSDRDGHRLFLRESWRGYGAFRINWVELDRDEATRLGGIIEDAIGQWPHEGAVTVDRDEARYHEVAAGKGLSLWRRDEDLWSLGTAPQLEPLQPGRPIEPSETFISDDRIRLADGRIFKREMTTAELRDALGVDGEGPAAST
jgi:hypothetical protein